MMRRMRRCLSVLLVPALLAQAPPAAATPKPAPPNIVLIVADDLGYGDLGCYGGIDIPTPRIDALAAAGARCTDGYVTCPVCAPTRAGLLSGRYQQRFGLELNPGPAGAAADGYGLPRTEPTLAETLAKAGYRTGMVGKWHLGYGEGLRPTERGFPSFFGFLAGAHPYRIAGNTAANPILRGTEPETPARYLTTQFGDEAVAFVKQPKDQPFFLYLAFNAVHAPLQAPPAVRQSLDAIADPKRRTFAGMLVAMDHAVGQLLDALHEQGLDDHTLVLFVSDNGGPTKSTTANNGPLRGFKGQTWEGGIRVPFALRWPGHVPAGSTFKLPCSSLDLHATALAAAGVEGRKELEGVDLLPYLKGDKQGPVHEALFWRFGQQRAVRCGDLKLVQAVDGKLQLFDLKKDIGEGHDLSTERPDDVGRLEKLYAAWNEHNIEPRWRRGQGRDDDK